MSPPPPSAWPIPEETARIAHAAHPRGTYAMRLRDHLGEVYPDAALAELFDPVWGPPGQTPGHLALVCVLQFVEGLADRQAADAVRSRIDWKYALGLELSDAGFNHTLVHDFRARLLAQPEAAARLLFDRLLALAQAHGLLRAGGRQRTDSTHVLAAVRDLSRLELVGETLRLALDALAEAAPEWLLAQVPDDWFSRYGPRVSEWRLPRAKAARQALAEQIGQDGQTLLAALAAPDGPAAARDCPAVAVLAQVWAQQYEVRAPATPAAARGRWRLRETLPPLGEVIVSPHDPEARRGQKRATHWTGYVVHVTDTCASDQPHLVTQVTTTPAAVPDVTQTAPIQTALATTPWAPDEQVVDAGYVAADLLVSSPTRGLDLLGPVGPDTSWQAQAGQGYASADFAIDWHQQVVTCPQGQTSARWAPGTRRDREHRATPVIRVAFDRATCGACAARAACTRATVTGRSLTLLPQAEHAALAAARQRQATPAFRAQYAQRAGSEATLALGVTNHQFRQARYRGLAKVQLQHLLGATALNVVRLDAWWRATGPPQHRAPGGAFCRLGAALAA